mmetsp:Transcript_8185/g.17545  ORF Transcript_8185/g.17545 Transcript_8185/m.17545 type:complete len:457 (-) Transcript_8185:169-1539(-)
MADSRAGRKLTTDSKHPALKELDAATAFLYTPHTITVLASIVVCISYFAGVFESIPSEGDASPRQGVVNNTARGIWACIFVYLAYSVVHGPRSSMVRPHPAFWRLAHGVLVVYILFLVFLVFQSAGDARQFLKHLSPSLGSEVQYRTYAADCSLLTADGGVNWPAIKSTLLDEFVLAHFLGWWAKALVLRNYALLWIISIGFELMELTFRHMLPNFNECWWDSWVLDVALCNLAGIVLGMATVHYFECKYRHYNWQGLSQLRGLRAKARRSLAQLLPYSWDRFEWMTFHSPRRFLQAMFMVVMFLAFELNVFFLKYALWIPPTNPLNTYRLVLWFLCALPGTRDYYEFLEGRSLEYGVFPKLGAFAWMAIAITCLETLCSIKFGRGLYLQPWPPTVVAVWTSAAVLLLTWLLVWQTRGPFGRADSAEAASPNVAESAQAKPGEGLAETRTEATSSK